MRTEVVLEFGNKHGVVREPGCMLTGVKGRFKPMEHSPVEVRQHIGDFTVVGKSVGSVTAVQETLGQE